MTALCWLLTMAASAATAQGREYRNSLLKQAAQKLGVAAQLDSVQADTTVELLANNGQQLTARLGRTGMVDHIGLPLFSSEVRQAKPSPVYDCLEYAALQHQQRLSENDLLWQSIQFLQGSWTTLCGVTPTDALELTTLENKRYLVTWQRDDKPFLSVMVPINYELLQGTSRRELESNFVRRLALAEKQPLETVPLVEALLKKYDSTDVYVLPADTLLMAALNRNTYYELATITQEVDSVTYEEQRIIPLDDTLFPGETLANLLIGADESKPDATIALDFQLIGNRQQRVHTTLWQLTTFCRQQGCVPYYIYTQSDSTHIAASLLMHNAAEGYSHLFNLKIPQNSLMTSKPELTGRAFLYIPFIEADRLFGKPAEEKSMGKTYKIHAGNE